jgi:2-iminobutanoate/2-iminopropanoate deaminase
MLKLINPPTIAASASRYSQAVEVPANHRWLYISGQVGVSPDGTVEQGFEAQAGRAWSNLVAGLEAANMNVADLLRVNAYLTRVEDVPGYRAVRDRVLGMAKPASTLVIVAALIDPRWLIEIEAVAAKES